MSDTLRGNGDTFTTSRIATQPWSLALYGKAAKAPNLDAMATCQCIAYCVDDGVDSHLGIALCWPNRAASSATRSERFMERQIASPWGRTLHRQA